MSAKSSPSRSLLPRLALAAASVLLVLLVAELAARVHTAGRPRRDPTAAKRALLADEPELPIYRSVSQLGEPNIRGIFKGHLHRTNRTGLRGPEYSPLPDPGVFRIVVIGDSVTMGSGVAEAAAYPARLEEWLNRAPSPTLPNARYEVINAGLGGIHARQAMNRLEEVIRDYHPHLAIYGFTINDIEGPSYVRLDQPQGQEGYMARSRRFNRSPSHLLRVLWPRLMSLMDMTSPTSYASEIQHNYFENPGAWRALRAELRRFAAMTKSAGICGHALIHTQLAQLGFLHPFEDTYERMGTAFDNLEIGVTQSLPFFQGEYGFDYWVTPIDPHPNAAGHDVLSRSLMSGLRALPETCWEVRGRDHRPDFAAWAAAR
jgi:lysophospholipase L1-like esterase